MGVASTYEDNLDKYLDGRRYMGWVPPRSKAFLDLDRLTIIAAEANRRGSPSGNKALRIAKHKSSTRRRHKRAVSSGSKVLRTARYARENPHWYPLWVARSFEEVVPEVRNGTVEIVSVVGTLRVQHRYKVAVRALKPGIDPVRSCVGPRGVLVRDVTVKVGCDRIDLFEWDEDIERFIANSLGRVNVVAIKIDPSTSRAHVTVPKKQMGAAIGRSWTNVKLASLVTGYDIKVNSTKRPRRSA